MRLGFVFLNSTHLMLGTIGSMVEGSLTRFIPDFPGGVISGALRLDYGSGII
jgi:hypothetical protein